MEKKARELTEQEMLNINGGSMHSAMERDAVMSGGGGTTPPVSILDIWNAQWTYITS